MSDSFYEWLNSCPTQWVLINKDSDSLTYTFVLDESEEEEDN